MTRAPNWAAPVLGGTSIPDWTPENLTAANKSVSYGNLPYNEDMPDTSRLEARLPSETYTLLKRAAEIEGRTLSDFVVSAAREAASRTIEKAEVLRLAVDDQKLFAATILNPPAPNAALKRAAKRRRQLLG